MTLKTSSFRFGKLVTFRFKQLAWLTTLWSVALFFALPVMQSMNLGFLMSQDLYNNPDVNLLIGNENYLVLIGALITGIITACVVQAFMNSKTQNDLWLSLPVRREKLFAANLTAGAMTVLIPLTVAYVLTILLTVFTPGARAIFAFSEVFSGYLRVIGLFLVAYAITTLWCAISGRTIIAVLCALFTPMIGSAAVVLASILCQMEFKTFYFSEQVEKVILALCPFGSFFTVPIEEFEPMPVMNFIWTAVAIGLLVLSGWLYQKRPSEKAGNAFVYPKALPIVKYPFILLSAAIGWLLFKAVTGEYGWAIFGAVAIGLCIFCVVNVLEKFDFRNILHHWWKYAATLAVFGLCMGVLILDPFGYDIRLPAREKVTEAKVYQLTLSEVDLALNTKITDPDTIDWLYYLSQFAVEHEEDLRFNGTIDNNNGVAAGARSANLLNYTVEYNGFARSYTMYIDYENRDMFDAIFSSANNIIQTHDIFTLESGTFDSMSLVFEDISLSYTIMDLKATGFEGGGEIGDIFDALRSDMQLTNKKNLEQANVLCVLRLKCELNDITVAVPIYDYFEKIRETWLWPAIEKYMIINDPERIESIRINRHYDSYSQTITDPAQIAELAPALVTSMDAPHNPLVTVDKAFKVTVFYKDGTFAYPSLCEERLPEWLKKS